MEHFIKYVNIQNFKSIANMKLEDCRRINLFIGYPNVGKSNVLEALSLFSAPFLSEGENLNKLVRVGTTAELFNSSSEEHESIVETNVHKISLVQNDKFFPFRIFHAKGSETNSYGFDKKLELLEKMCYYSRAEEKANFHETSKIKRYSFISNKEWKSNGKFQLLPPFGENIIDILSYNQDMADVYGFIKKEFEKYRLQLVLNKIDKSLLIQQKLKDDAVFLLPFSSISDTLQRAIFYKTAIASNKNSVLLFEEPEAHAFPPYISNMMQDIIDAKTNQFFIVTHSPFVTNDFLEYEHLRRETSIYLFDFKDNQTIVKRLTDEEMDELYYYGADLFYNIEKFLEAE